MSSTLERSIDLELEGESRGWGDPLTIDKAVMERIQTTGSSLGMEKSSKPKEHSDTLKPATVKKAEPIRYPEIRAKYDAKIQEIKEKPGVAKSDKKLRIRNLELRYQNEVKEKYYKKVTLISLAVLLVVTISAQYASVYWT